MVPVLAKQDVQIKQSALSFVPNGTSLRTQNWSYMKYEDGTEEFYNMKTDPKQFTNLSKSKEDRIQLLKHRKLLTQRKKAIQ